MNIKQKSGCLSSLFRRYQNLKPELSGNHSFIRLPRNFMNQKHLNFATHSHMKKALLTSTYLLKIGVYRISHKTSFSLTLIHTSNMSDCCNLSIYTSLFYIYVSKKLLKNCILSLYITTKDLSFFVNNNKTG